MMTRLDGEGLIIGEKTLFPGKSDPVSGAVRSTIRCACYKNNTDDLVTILFAARVTHDKQI